MKKIKPSEKPFLIFIHFGQTVTATKKAKTLVCLFSIDNFQNLKKGKIISVANVFLQLALKGSFLWFFSRRLLKKRTDYSSGFFQDKRTDTFL